MFTTSSLLGGLKSALRSREIYMVGVVKFYSQHDNAKKAGKREGWYDNNRRDKLIIGIPTPI